MGQVWLARDTDLGREVALKELQGDHADGTMLSRFVEEAKVTGQLEHPNIVPVYELARDERSDVYGLGASSTSCSPARRLSAVSTIATFRPSATSTWVNY